MTGLLQPTSSAILRLREETTGREITILRRDIVGPRISRKTWLNNLHVACFYAGYCDNLEVDENSDDRVITSALRRRLIFSDRNLTTFGEYAVVVRRLGEFISRIRNAAEARQYGYAHAPVQYYDYLSFHGTFSDTEAVFRKTMAYAYQQEFRVALNTPTVGDDPFTPDIGCMKDMGLIELTLQRSNPI